MTAHEFDISLSMTPEQEAQFRIEQGLPDDEDLGPHVAREAQTRLRQAGLFRGVDVDLQE
ncbi:hypothetical protein [Nocardiopsis sp. JB363]|uniref:hypothetical protein n=1 Tax=Nocardiopsis sp. JB363 TaxID=1434837 RepID=UPI00097A674B|nr:hypothetical protein [Nocardiopsis sp. JB363]SIO88455.1 hypothetical protein BQ8420_19105 [Nocardiopsis sp. JB363]